MKEIENILSSYSGYDCVNSIVKKIINNWPYPGVDISTLSKRCKKCAITENYEKAAPFVDGLCQFCMENPKIQSIASRKKTEMVFKKGPMFELLNNHKAKEAGYDIVVLFSGGKDSSFMLYQIIKLFPKLKILALTIDNGYRVPVSLESALKIAATLGVEYKVIKSSNEIFKRLFSDFIEKNYKEGADYFEAYSGQLMFDTAKKYATENEIPFIATGYTPDQISSRLKYQDIAPFFPKDAIMKADDIVKEERKTIHGELLHTVFNEEQIDFFWDGSKTKEKDVIPALLFPFVDWGYNKDLITDTVNKILPIQESHPLITNNVIVCIVCDYVRLGYCSIEPEFARMVRHGVTNYKDNLAVWQTLEYLSLCHTKLLLKAIEPLIEEIGYTLDELTKAILAKTPE